MKLSINGPALERLLGGDTELEIELRHQVIKNFAKEHLRGLLEGELLRLVEKELNQVREQISLKAQQHIKDEVGCFKKEAWYVTHELNDKIKELVGSLVIKTVKEQIDKSIAWETQNNVAKLQQWVDAKIKAVFDQNIREQINIGVKERLEKAASI